MDLPQDLPGHVDESCPVEIPLNSPGLLVLKGPNSFLEYSLPRLQLQLAVIFTVTQSLHLLLRRYGVPRIVPEILAGILLGQTGLGKLPSISGRLFPQDGEIFLDILSKLGYVFFIFLSGVKMDPKAIFRTGWKAWTIGALAVAIPSITCGQYYKRVFEVNLHRYRWTATRAIFGIQNMIAFPVIANLLVDLEIINSELGRLALASTLISDLLSNVMSAVVSNLRAGWMGWQNTLGTKAFVISIGTIFLIYFIMLPISALIIKQTPEGKPVSKVFIGIMACGVVFTLIWTDNVGLNYQLGPFVLGLAVSDGPPFGSTLVENMDTLVSGLFAPLLVSYTAMKVDMFQLYDLAYVGTICHALAIGLLIKCVSIFFPAMGVRVPMKDAVALTFIMCTQGIVQVSVYFNSIVNQTFDGDTFNVLVLSVPVIALLCQFAVKATYDYSRTYVGYQKRDIQHAAYNSELRLLSCAHRLDDVVAVKKLLEASFPNKDSPLSVYALHLVELAGRASPLLIDHQLGQKVSSGGSRSQKMIEVYQSFEEQYMGLVSVQMYTSISLPKFMQHDICSVAFEKSTSMIIVPFHRKWNQQGKMILDSSSLRILNCEVMEMAPCSVSILIDRHKIRRTSPPPSKYTVAVVFLGGTDDREALAYAKRMARSPGVHLTVVRFVAWDTVGDNQWDAVLDAEILKEIRLQGSHQGNILYREEKVKDGAETALIIHEMEEAFDLIMVGRRHREELPQLLGLTEWNELPELGPIGDMLAAAEINRPVSALVVQHQIVKSK